MFAARELPFAPSTYLWIADYVSSSAPVPTGWSTWTFWQHTASATVPGIPTRADRNWFNGSLTDLRRLAGLDGGFTRDVTGNGWDDIVARNASDGNLCLYDGFADGRLASPRKIGSGWGGTTTVMTGEFTGDGQADLLGVNVLGELNVYAGSGGTFAAPRKLGTGWNAQRSIVTGAFTTSGHDDIIGIQNDSGDLYFYAGNGSTFAAPRKLASGWGGQTALVAGDFNHDGHADLVGRTADGTLNLYPSTGTGLGTAVRSAAAGTAWISSSRRVLRGAAGVLPATSPYMSPGRRNPRVAERRRPGCPGSRGQRGRTLSVAMPHDRIKGFHTRLKTLAAQFAGHHTGQRTM
ncbi:FG-GAP-like repeat-containing protein [Amycolatopsis sp. NPDC059657]|uniref:FG-GAP-like repeat-containing protein n=1 Tax=Amycolatopsis sp. NPDC059657 TaxID=3346899 RepID=UPI00366DD7DC